MLATDKDLAGFAMLGLRLGVLKLPAVSAWADGIIADRADPPSWVIELAVADINQAISALNSVPGVVTDALPVRLLLAHVYRLWERGQLTMEQVKGIGW